MATQYFDLSPRGFANERVTLKYDDADVIDRTWAADVQAAAADNTSAYWTESAPAHHYRAVDLTEAVLGSVIGCDFWPDDYPGDASLCDEDYWAALRARYTCPS